MSQPITLFEYVAHIVGQKDSYTLADHNEAGVPMIGGCVDCHATVGSYNACPTKRGFLACAEHTDPSDGFATVLELHSWMVESDLADLAAEQA